MVYAGEIKNNGMVRTYYKSGALGAETNCKTAKRQCTQKSYYENGTLLMEVNFGNSESEYASKEYYNNGVLKSESTSKDDHSEIKTYSKTGALESRSTHKNNGDLDGVFETFDQNGALKTRTYYKDGKQVGETGIYEDTKAIEETIKWYLNVTGEKRLQTFNGKFQEVYRFFVQPMGYISEVIRIERNGGQYKLFHKQNKTGGQNPQFIENVKFISQEDWNGFIRLLTRFSFWDMPNRDSRIGSDGITYILEGVNHGKYHFVSRWTPEEGAFLQACKYLVNLSKNK